MLRREALQIISGMTLAVLLPGCGRSGSSGHALEGTPFPAFSLPDLNGRMHHSTDYAGSPLLVNFWATWCPPCRSEMPDLQALHARLAPRGLRVLGISVDNDVNLVREFLLKVPVDFPILLDGQHKLAEGSVRLDGYPTTFLVSRNDAIVEVIGGVRPWAEAEYAESIARRLTLV